MVTPLYAALGRGVNYHQKCRILSLEITRNHEILREITKNRRKSTLVSGNLGNQWEIMGKQQIIEITEMIEDLYNHVSPHYCSQLPNAGF